MYNFLLILCAVLTAGQFVFLKRYQKVQSADLFGALVFSALIGLFQTVFALFATGFSPRFGWFSAGMAAAFSLCVIACTVLGLKVVRLGKLSVYTLFMMLGGMNVPLLFGVAFLEEQMKLSHIAAVVLLMISLCIPALERTTASSRTSRLFYPLCCVLFLLNGAVSTVSKAHQIDPRAVGTFDFMFLIGLTELLISAVLLLFIKGSETPLAVLKKGKPVLCALGYALVASGASFLQFYSAKEVNASILYPIQTGGTVVFTALFALWFFREKFNRYTAASTVVAFLGTLLFLL